MSYHPSKLSKQNKKSKLPYVLAGTVLIVIGFAAVFYFNKSDDKPTSSTISASETIRYDPSTPEEIAAANDLKVDVPVSTPAPSSPAADRVAITSLRQDESSKNVVVQTKLSGNGWRTCELKLSRGSTVITKTVDVLFQSEFSTCKGFVISSSEFDTSGTWSARLTSANADGASETTSKNIEVVK